MVDQGSVCVDGDGLVGGHRGCGKGLNISEAGTCGGDGMGVSGEAVISKKASHIKVFLCETKLYYAFASTCDMRWNYLVFADFFYCSFFTFLPICGAWRTGTVLMTSVCPVTGSWASWVCPWWCRCDCSDASPGDITGFSNPETRIHTYIWVFWDIIQWCPNVYFLSVFGVGTKYDLKTNLSYIYDHKQAFINIYLHLFSVF